MPIKYQKTWGVCPVCGACFSPCKNGGRPARFCSSNCGDVWKFFNAFETRLNACRLDRKQKKYWRGSLFTVANNLVSFYG